ncbi:HET domain-containing protein [Trichoderma evansii]
MRLINTGTFELEEFSDVEPPPYAILSHTWGRDFEELTYFDVKNGMIDKPGIGSFKFRHCCEQAQKDSLKYAWIDTCCIDKTNLVELGEAINSMFRWYSLATVCYAYLSDVPDNDAPPAPESEFRISRWFKRGWTLQELLAPKHLRFYNSEWHCIGTKGSRCTVIQEITQIPRQFLLGVAELHTASVAQRMSWAAQRETKRAEDLAYSLLGIFGITMPMIYGEGGREAFFRLQEQIMKTTRDDSILAWGLDVEPSISNPQRPKDGDMFIYGDILAATPSDFAHSGQIITREQATNPLHSLDIFGGSLRVYLPLLATENDETFGLLSCGPKSDAQQVLIKY